MGLGMSDFLRMEAEAKAAGGDTGDNSVIFIWLPGGLPHMETYDMKPEAPSEYRGDFRPIKTNVKGIEVCELLPMHAKIADKFAIVGVSGDTEIEAAREAVQQHHIPWRSFRNDRDVAGKWHIAAFPT